MERSFTPEKDIDWELDGQLSVTGSVVSLDVAGDIPAEGWPDTFKPAVVERISGYVEDIEE